MCDTAARTFERLPQPVVGAAVRATPHPRYRHTHVGVLGAHAHGWRRRFGGVGAEAELCWQLCDEGVAPVRPALRAHLHLLATRPARWGKRLPPLGQVGSARSPFRSPAHLRQAGSFGRVFFGLNTESGEVMAVKQINYTPGQLTDATHQAAQESHQRSPWSNLILFPHAGALGGGTMLAVSHASQHRALPRCRT